MNFDFKMLYVKVQVSLQKKKLEPRDSSSEINNKNRPGPYRYLLNTGRSGGVSLP